MNRILYIFLPCKQIYPVGCTYLAEYIHRRRPEIHQRILDLSQVPPSERSKTVREIAEAFHPDLVCFSWRDIQIFSPHEGDASLEQAFTFYYSNNPLKKLAASFSGVKSLYQYYSGIRANLSHAWLIRKTCPDAQIMIGGGAFGAFADQLIEKLPEGTIGILGEGEEAILKMVEGKPLDGERFIASRDGKTIKGLGQSYTDLSDFAVDLPYITSVFPQYTTYKDDCIGVQSKRGCPYDCAFCLYPYLEGKSVRYRPASLVVQDIAQHYHRWGTRRFWFTDAQFITGKAAYPQCTEIMERIIAEKLELEWSGYIRTSLITAELARLMVRSGVGDLEVAITSGSQEVLNGLHMGFMLDRLYDGCRYLAEAGFTGKIILNYSLNAPDETAETLRDSIESYKKVVAILGEERVFPMMFFLGIQPNTDLEHRLLEEGYLTSGYNPLMLTPTSIRKLLYNPAPLSKLIGKACLAAWNRKKGARTGSRDPRPWGTGQYADQNLLRGVELNSGRDVLLRLEEILNSSKSARNQVP
ncbi:MAG TPA: radical SAM protein [Nitrospirales bacterium]|jgi:radical SAM superfamily enzyme YgiQ (UPF0313 family)|nr:radical SAM protein [Nitrospirales bacterium]